MSRVASRNRRTGGVGLGLTIARRILLAHGGDLVAGNGAEGGAIFVATLPSPARTRSAPDAGAPDADEPVATDTVVSPIVTAQR